MKTPISISQLARIFACVFAGVLPQVRHVGRFAATRGKVLHKFLCDVLVDGYDQALAVVPIDFRESCEVIDFRLLPKAGEFAAEVAFAYNWRDDTARELGRNMDRRYDGLVDEETEIAGTADVVGVTEEAAVVLDYKTGWADLGPAGNSWQLKGYAVAAARAYGKTRATVGFVRIGMNGKPFFDVVDLNAAELDAAAGEMRALLRRVTLLRQLGPSEQHEHVMRVFLDGRPPEDLGTLGPAQYVEGPHCRQCASVPFCAAKMRLVAQLASAPQNMLDSGSVPVLSERELSTAYERLERVKLLVKHVEDALEERAAVTPFPIESRPGWVYGPVEKVEDEVQLEESRGLLRDRYGLTAANAAIKSEMTKASIERALEAHWIRDEAGARIPGRKITPTMRAFVEAARKPQFMVTFEIDKTERKLFDTAEEALAFYSEISKLNPTAQNWPEPLIAIRRVTSFPVKAHKVKPELPASSTVEGEVVSSEPVVEERKG